MKGLGALMRKTPESSLTPASVWRDSHLRTRKQVPPVPGSQTSRLPNWEINVYNPVMIPVCGILLEQSDGPGHTPGEMKQQHCAGTGEVVKTAEFSSPRGEISSLLSKLKWHTSRNNSIRKLFRHMKKKAEKTAKWDENRRLWKVGRVRVLNKSCKIIYYIYMHK